MAHTLMTFTLSNVIKPIYTQYNSSTILLFILLLAINVFDKVEITNAFTLPKNATIPALFVFGDSLVDPGNNNNLNTIGKCNFPPYGKDFDGGVATGRYSNGRIPGDMLVEAFSVKRNLPAYLDPDLKLEDLLTGVSFASGASGYDPLTAKLVNVLSLDDQLNLFREYIGKIRKAGEERAATIVSQGVFVVCTGTNDILNTYNSLRKAQNDLPSYTEFLTESASNFTKELYDLGARRIGVINLPPIGCVPSQRTLGGGPDRRCFDFGNEAAMLFNNKLYSKVNHLSQKLPDAKLVYIDSYYVFLDIIKNPSNYGFEENTKGCCGTGYIEVSFLCNGRENPDIHTCIDDTKYVFWDSYHPTERAYQIIITSIVNKYASKFF